MKKRNAFVWIHTIVPVLIMFVLAYLAFANIGSRGNPFYSEDLIIVSIIIYYPLLFFLQGLACALLQSNIFVSLGTSIVAYIVIMILWLNSSAIGYILFYLIVWFLGYGLINLTRKLKR